MELSKALLGAILLGIAVQTTSCKKDKNLPTPANPNGTPVQVEENHDPCPACGLG